MNELEYSMVNDSFTESPVIKKSVLRSNISDEADTKGNDGEYFKSFLKN